MDKKIVIAHLYPDLLNLYGDKGNIACLEQRLRWRGMEVEVVEVLADEEPDFARYDIVLLGGGSDKEQKMVCEKLRSVQPQLREYVENNGVMLALCGGYEMLGQYFDNGGESLAGLQILNSYTEFGTERMFANVIMESDITDMPVVGFANHSGCTHIGEHRPFGDVIVGYGNVGEKGQEGVIYKNLIGTYLYGPLLPKNPEVADWLLAQALERKYGRAELTTLDDTVEKAGNAYICNRFAAK